MADIKITNLPLGTDMIDQDELLYIDVSDTTAGPNGTDKRIKIGKLRDIATREITTTFMIGNTITANVGDVVTSQGFSNKGDGGAGQWLLTSETGTPSKTPAELGDAKFTDANGRVWVLVKSNNVEISKLGVPSVVEEAAISSADSVVYQYPDDFVGIEVDNNIFTSAYDQPMYKKVKTGSKSQPEKNPNTQMFLQKYTELDRTERATEWDLGNVYAQVTKTGGDAYLNSICGVVRYEAGSGDAIAIHGRAQARSTDAEIWGGWFYAEANYIGDHAKEMIGVEINMNNGIADVDELTNRYRGLVVVTADGGGTCDVGIDVGAQNGTGGWLHSYRARANATASSSATGLDTSQYVIEGSTSSADRYGGIKFSGNYFTYGIDFTGIVNPISNNAAISLRYDDVIRWGGTTGSRYISVTDEDQFSLNLTNLSLSVNGVRVVGTRKTGWVTPTGTSSKSTFDTATVTTEELARRVRALIVDLTSHGLIGE